jgi:hypothetical protein
MCSAVLSLYFGICSTVSFSHFKNLLHPLWHNFHTWFHGNKFGVPKVQTDRPSVLVFFSSMLKLDIKPDMLLVLAALHTQVLEMLRCQFVLLGTWLAVVQDNVVMSPARVERSLNFTPLCYLTTGNKYLHCGTICSWN